MGIIGVCGVLVLLAACVRDCRAAAVPPPPPCITSVDDFGYVNGSISSSQTFYNCLANIPDAALLPTYYDNKVNGPVTFSVAMTLSNLIAIDEIQGTATLSFSLGMSWTDQRFAMPLFWTTTGSKTLILTTLVANDSVVIFQPQIRFADGIEVDITNQELSLNNKNLFVWKGAVVLTAVESGFTFKKFPGDTQDVVVRMYIYPFDNRTAIMSIYGNGISFSTDQYGANTFSENQVWDYENATATTYLSQGASSSTSYALFTITMQRQGSGIVLRLVVPVLLLLILSTLTFWAAHEERVNVTITILLSISALYIVILGNVPLVGYLTDLDEYIFWMFLLLVIIIILHQIYATIHQKLERWPLRIVYLRLVECTGRTAILPAIVLFYLQKIPEGQDSYSNRAIVASILVISGLIFSREVFGLRAAWKLSMQGLVAKINDPDTVLSSMSWVELLVINAWRFGVFSTSPLLLGREMQANGSLDVDFVQNIKLRNITKVLGDTPGPATTPLGLPGLRRRTLGMSQSEEPREVQLSTFGGTQPAEVANPIVFKQDLEVARSSIARQATFDSDDET